MVLAPSALSASGVQELTSGSLKIFAVFQLLVISALLVVKQPELLLVQLQVGLLFKVQVGVTGVK